MENLSLLSNSTASEKGGIVLEVKTYILVLC